MTQDPEDLRVLDALGRAVPQVAPPAELRARVLAAATREPASREPATPASSTPLSFPNRTAAAPAVARSSRWPWLVAAAAAVLAAATSFAWLSARDENARLHATIADLRANTTVLLAARDDFERERSRRERADSILSAGDVIFAALAGVAPVADARGRVYVSPSRGLLFAAENLPTLPSDRSYQLWAIVDGQPFSHGVFELADGRAQLLAEPPPGPAAAFAVTVEPIGGVPAPTGPQVLLGTPMS
jgi:anti-sigma-K factor RskA